MKTMARKDITDEMIVRFLLDWNRARDKKASRTEGRLKTTFPQYLAEKTGKHEKVAYRALERAAERDFINYGTSLNFPFLGSVGLKYALEQELIEVEITEKKKTRTTRKADVHFFARTNTDTDVWTLQGVGEDEEFGFYPTKEFFTAGLSGQQYELSPDPERLEMPFVKGDKEEFVMGYEVETQKVFLDINEEEFMNFKENCFMNKPKG
jgi:hypothetical protein